MIESSEKSLLPRIYLNLINVAPQPTFNEKIKISVKKQLHLGSPLCHGLSLCHGEGAYPARVSQL